MALPPRAKDGLVVFGKNSARPRDEVQEVVYFPAVDHEAESKVEVGAKMWSSASSNAAFWLHLLTTDFFPQKLAYLSDGPVISTTSVFSCRFAQSLNSKGT